MIYEVCFDSRRGCGMDVNCFFLFCVKIAGDGTEMEVGDEGWRSNIPIASWGFIFLRMGVGVELYAPDE